MTHQENYNLSTRIIEVLAQNRLVVIPEIVRVILKSVMLAEQSQHLQAKAYKQTTERKGHANGYKPLTVRTKLGDITFAIPHIREGGFYPSTLEKDMRSKRASLIALAEMYVQGVLIRRVKAITEELYGVEISAMQIGRAAQQLDDVLKEWRERPLGEI